MRSQHNGGVNGGGTVGTADDAQRAGFLGGKTHSNGTQQNRKNSNLRSGPEKGQAQVTQHGSKIGQGSYPHKNNGRQKSGLNQRIIQVVQDRKSTRLNSSHVRISYA